MKIPTPIPRSLAEKTNSISRERLLLIGWRAVLVVLLVGAVAVVSQLGGGIGVVAGVLVFLTLSAWVGDSFRAAMADVWNADFYTLGD